MKVFSGVIDQGDGQWFFDIEYTPEYPSFENFRRWFTRPAGPLWKRGMLNVFATTVTDIGDGRARISGGPSVKSMYADLSKIYPQTYQ
jgi:hypothetical protein